MQNVFWNRVRIADDFNQIGDYGKYIVPRLNIVPFDRLL